MRKSPGLATRIRYHLGWSQIQENGFLLCKAVYQAFKFRGRPRAKTTIVITGCQRSGTNLLRNLFERDWRTKGYGEFSRLSDENSQEGIRFKPLAQVRALLDRQRVPIVVIKPLVEAQHAGPLLDRLENAKMIWIYRHYQGVAKSDLARWGMENGIRNLRPIVRNDPQDWRSEGASDHVRQVVAEAFSEDMNPNDAAVLFWYARNALFFERHLDTNPNVAMCRYEDLVTDPGPLMREIYRFLGVEFPGDRILSIIHARSLKRGRDLTLSPEIERRCQEMLDRLDGAYGRQHGH